eukprot:EG_transcript_6469
MALVEDNSLMHRLEQGKFGEFRRAIDRLAFDWSAFALPRIVVVGSESAGKSSLIENVTKCAVFPRDQDICTKMPVCLEMKTSETSAIEVEHAGTTYPLQSRDEIRGAIKNAFDQLGNTVKEEEVVVRITHPGVPTLTLVDLPGIRTYPAELAQQTTKLTERFLMLPHTLVICVVQAADRLTANNAVALTMTKLGPETATRAILVLTKPDLVSDAEWEEKVAARLRGTSRELLGTKFAKCVSVVSRPQQADGSENLPLAQMDEAENSWWPRKLPEVALHSTVGVQQLISMVNEVFSNYIQTTWKGRALEMLKRKQAEATEALEVLGPDPATLTAQQVHADVCARLNSLGIGWRFTFERLAARPVTKGGHGWEWALDFTRLSKEVQAWAQRLLAAPQLPQDVRGIVAAAFDDRPPLRPRRFDALRRALVRSAEAECEARRPAAAKQVDRLVEEGLDQLRLKEHQTQEDLWAVERSVLRAVSEFTSSAVGAVAALDPARLSLEECPEVKAQRERLSADLDCIAKAMQTIQGL